MEKTCQAVVEIKWLCFDFKFTMHAIADVYCIYRYMQQKTCYKNEVM